MQKSMFNGFKKAYIALIVIHILVTLGFALVFGTNHPFSSQYMIHDLYPLIVSSMTLATLLYLLGGYLFVVSKENVKNLLKYILVAVSVFTFVLLIIWFTTRLLSVSGTNRNIWLLYVISNYPTAIIYNTIIDLEDLHAFELVLTIFPPAIGFISGSLLRLVYEPQWRKKS
jgi:hypothetical protein